MPVGTDGAAELRLGAAGAPGAGRSPAVVLSSRCGRCRSVGRSRGLRVGWLSAERTQRKPQEEVKLRGPRVVRCVGLQGPASPPRFPPPPRRLAVGGPSAGRGAPRGSAPCGCCTYRNGARCRPSPLPQRLRRCTASPPSRAGAAPGAALNVSAALSRVCALLWAAALRFVHRR